MTNEQQVRSDRSVMAIIAIVILILSINSCRNTTQKADKVKKIDSVMTCRLESGKPDSCTMEPRQATIAIDTHGNISIEGDTIEAIKTMWKIYEHDEHRLELADTIIRKLIKDKYEVFNRQM